MGQAEEKEGKEEEGHRKEEERLKTIRENFFTFSLTFASTCEIMYIETMAKGAAHHG